jgi:pimeloyl-ACP methyl ester carboxylesterase
MSCSDRCYQNAVRHAPECELPPECRGHLYVYMVHGLTPTTDSGLEALQLKLSECGFPKVGVGELSSAPLVWYDIRQTLKCDPDARFVLLGYDLGGAAAVCLARDLSARGVPVDAVVLLDPVACRQPGGIPTLVVSSGAMPATLPPGFETADQTGAAAPVTRVVVPDSGHFKLPAHPQTVAAVLGLLKEIAAQHYREPADPIAAWSYRHAPEMQATPGGARLPEWNFLADSGEMPAAIAAPAALPTARTAAPAAPSTSAGAVLLKR